MIIGNIIDVQPVSLGGAAYTNGASSHQFYDMESATEWARLVSADM